EIRPFGLELIFLQLG
ncbi:RNA pseudouridylate synthase family protein, partial [Vibrio harveyi]